MKVITVALLFLAATDTNAVAIRGTGGALNSNVGPPKPVSSATPEDAVALKAAVGNSGTTEFEKEGHTKRLCADLQRSLEGEVHCNVTNYDFDLHNPDCAGLVPDVVVRPASSSDVSKAILTAKKFGVPLSVRSGGHSYTCNAFKDSGIHLDLRSIKGRRIFQKDGEWFAQFETGNTFADLFKTMDTRRFTFLHGECWSVGVGGFFLHGGAHVTSIQEMYASWANETITSMEVVTADGQIRTLSDDSDDQLLWKAMRQAGSSFGVATSLTIRMWEVPEPTRWEITTPLNMTTSDILRWMEVAPSLKLSFYPLSHEIWAASKEGGLTMLDDLRQLVNASQAVSIRSGNEDSSYFGRYTSASTMVSRNLTAFIKVSLEASNQLDPTQCWQVIKPFRPDDHIIRPIDEFKMTYETTCFSAERNLHFSKTLSDLEDAYDEIDAHRSKYYNIPSRNTSNTDNYWGGDADLLRSIKQEYDADDLFHVYQGVRLLPNQMPSILNVGLEHPHLQADMGLLRASSSSSEN